MFTKNRPEYLMMASRFSSRSGKNSTNPLRLLCLLACFAGGPLCAQTTELLVFKNGRTMEIRGDYVIKGDKVEFYNTDGDLIFVNLDKVDLKTTEKYAEIRAENANKQPVVKKEVPADKPSLPTKETSLPEQIEKYQKQVAQKKDSNVKLLEYTGQPRQPDAKPDLYNKVEAGRYGRAVEKLIPQWVRPEGSIPAENARELFEGSYGAVWFGWLILGGLMGLASFLTWLFIMIISYSRSLLWGAGLTLSFMGLIALALVPAISGQLRPAIYLVHYGLFVGFLFKQHGKRLLLFTLWVSPYIWGAITVAGLLFWKS